MVEFHLFPGYVFGHHGHGCVGQVGVTDRQVYVKRHSVTAAGIGIRPYIVRENGKAVPVAGEIYREYGFVCSFPA